MLLTYCTILVLLLPYCTAVLRNLAPDTVRAIKDRLISELVNNAKNVAEQPGPTAPRHSDLSEDPDVLDLFIVEEEPGTNRRQEEELMESFVRSMDRWQRRNTKIPVNKNLFPMEHRDAWVDLFIKYNTPIPSSAAVECIFSTAGDIIRPKRSSLAASKFEELVFMKGNMDLLGSTQPRGRMFERS